MRQVRQVRRMNEPLLCDQPQREPGSTHWVFCVYRVFVWPGGGVDFLNGTLDFHNGTLDFLNGTLDFHNGRGCGHVGIDYININVCALVVWLLEVEQVRRA